LNEVLLFPFAEYWWLYASFLVLVLALLALDLGVFHREAREVSFREAGVWTALWIGLALLFNLLLWQYAHWRFPQDPRLLALPAFDPHAAADRVGLEYLAGFVVEKALAVDNIFVFVVVFSTFAIPARHQHRVLFFGILGALVFRAVFIAMGALLMQYRAVAMLFGAFLVLTGLKMLWVGDSKPNPERNPAVRLLRRMLPVTDGLRGQRFLVREGGRLLATPLLLALAFVEVADIVFAVDSVPAIYALTAEPLIVFTSNIFAILGLRSLYFMLADVLHRFHLLHYGLALVLVFVGLKMAWLNQLYGGKFPIQWSLAVIAGLIGLSVALSLLWREPEPPGVAVSRDPRGIGHRREF
jgi:tellurite resistance protein TerC